MLTNGVLANAFPVESTAAPITSLKLEGNLVDISQGFNLGKSLSPFLNTGILNKRGDIHVENDARLIQVQKWCWGIFYKTGKWIGVF